VVLSDFFVPDMRLPSQGLLEGLREGYRRQITLSAWGYFLVVSWDISDIIWHKM